MPEKSVLRRIELLEASGAFEPPSNCPVCGLVLAPKFCALHVHKVTTLPIRGEPDPAIRHALRMWCGRTMVARVTALPDFHCRLSECKPVPFSDIRCLSRVA